MGMFDNARADHERGMHIMGDTSGVCPYCRGEEVDENTRDACAACGTPLTLLKLMDEQFREHELGLHAMYTAWCPECEHNAQLESDRLAEVNDW